MTKALIMTDAAKARRDCMAKERDMIRSGEMEDPEIRRARQRETQLYRTSTEVLSIPAGTDLWELPI